MKSMGIHAQNSAHNPIQDFPPPQILDLKEINFMKNMDKSKHAQSTTA